MTPRYPRPLGITAALVLAGGAFGPTVAFAAEEDQVGLTIFNINDFHGRISATGEQLACTLETERAAVSSAGGSSLFLSAGDNIGATEFASYIQDDEPTIDYLNALGLDATAVGNHEFDRGYDVLAGDVTDRSDYEQLGANVFLENGERALPAYSLEETDGVTVAVIGAVTQETLSLVSPIGVSGLEFRDPIASVNDVIESDLADEDYDVIVVEFHEGSAESAPAGEVPESAWTERVLTELSAEAQLVFEAHTHQTYAFVDGERAVVQTGSYGANLGTVEVTVDTATDEIIGAPAVSNVVVPTEPGDDASAQEVEEYQAFMEACAAYPRFEEAQGILADAEEVAAEEGGVVIGEQTADITTAFAADRAAYVDGTWQYTGEGLPTKGDDRAESSALATLIANSQRDAEIPGGIEADLGIINPGGIRADLLYEVPEGPEEGQITTREANDVLPFVNNLSAVDLTGAQLDTLLEQQWQRDADGNVPSRPYLQLGLSDNVQYLYDATRDEGDRITAITLDGEPVDPAEPYTVIAPSFLATGGDNFHVFTEGRDYRDTGLVDRDAWMAYIEGAGALSPDYTQYGAELQGLTAGQTLTAGEETQATIGDLHNTSLDAPRVEAVSVALTIGGTTHELGEFDYTVDGTEGSAPLAFTVPADVAGEGVLTVAASAGETVVDVPVTIEAASGWTLGGVRAGETVNEGTSKTVTVDAPADGTVSLRLFGEDGETLAEIGPYEVRAGANEIGFTVPDVGAHQDGTPATLQVVADGEIVAVSELVVEPAFVAPAPPFADVEFGSAFFTEIVWLAESGITTGWPDGTFRPQEHVNRDAMVAFLYRMAGSPAVELPAESPFTDVHPGQDHYEAINWAHQVGITTGYADDTFRPTQPIDRDAMAAFVYRYAGQPEFEAPATDPFTDVDQADVFATEIAWLKDAGITTGYADDSYRPKESMDRDAMAAFIYRIDYQNNIVFTPAAQ